MKARRQAKILELIRDQVVETQEDLVDLLSRTGIAVTQATVSRDIKEMRLQKVPAGGGRYRYAMPEDGISVAWERHRRILRDAVLAVDCAENLIVIKTLRGSAPVVGEAIDHLAWDELVGSVAGDDTVLVVIKPRSAAPGLVERLQALIR